jgi:hypothetical protein
MHGVAETFKFVTIMTSSFELRMPITSLLLLTCDTELAMYTPGQMSSASKVANPSTQ